MMTFFKLYFLSLIVFFGIDLLWLGILAKNLYKEQIGFLMADEIKWGAALLFYALYIGGLVFFALLPALSKGNWVLALGYGAFFGLVSYATYDLTNLATLKGWPLKIVVLDLLWGSFISGATVVLTFLVANNWKQYF